MLRHVVIVFFALATLSSVALEERRVALVVKEPGMVWGECGVMLPGIDVLACGACAMVAS